MNAHMAVGAQYRQVVIPIVASILVLVMNDQNVCLGRSTTFAATTFPDQTFARHICLAVDVACPTDARAKIDAIRPQFGGRPIVNLATEGALDVPAALFPPRHFPSGECARGSWDRARSSCRPRYSAGSDPCDELREWLVQPTRTPHSTDAAA
jgi:hypothetical protein